MIAVKICALLVLVVVSNEALKCIPCDLSKCVPPEGCVGGLTLDICNCCQRCAKLEGEECGGVWKMSGICDKGLICDEPKADIYEPGKCVPKYCEY